MKTLALFKLAPETTHEDLIAECHALGFGYINARMVVTRMSTGNGWIRFGSHTQAEVAARAFTSRNIRGARIECRLATREIGETKTQRGEVKQAPPKNGQPTGMTHEMVSGPRREKSWGHGLVPVDNTHGRLADGTLDISKSIRYFARLRESWAWMAPGKAQTTHFDKAADDGYLETKNKRTRARLAKAA